MMDTSATYIKMCDCPEIQEGHKWGQGDIFIDCDKSLQTSGEVSFSDGIRLNGSYYFHYNDGGCGCCSDEYQPETWLPRQDQLQEIYREEKETDLAILADFCHSVLMKRDGFYKQFTSMEQLWLAFVMKEKFNKVWVNGEWNDSP
jgi:hypothetical protein